MVSPCCVLTWKGRGSFLGLLSWAWIPFMEAAPCDLITPKAYPPNTLTLGFHFQPRSFEEAVAPMLLSAECVHVHVHIHVHTHTGLDIVQRECVKWGWVSSWWSKPVHVDVIPPPPPHATPQWPSLFFTVWVGFAGPASHCHSFSISSTSSLQRTLCWNFSDQKKKKRERLRLCAYIHLTELAVFKFRFTVSPAPLTHLCSQVDRTLQEVLSPCPLSPGPLREKQGNRAFSHSD